MAAGVGERPAEVWGWARYPLSTRRFISLRIVAGETPIWYFLSRVSEPTGSAVWEYSSTMARRILTWRSVKAGSGFGSSAITSSNLTLVLMVVKNGIWGVVCP